MSDLKTIWLTDGRGALICLAKWQEQDGTRYAVGVARNAEETKTPERLMEYSSGINPLLRRKLIRFLGGTA